MRTRRSTNPADYICWSADVPDMQTLQRYLRDMPDLRYVKLDRLFLTRVGLEAISVVENLGRRVFADAKIAEIPEKLVGVAMEHLVHKPWMLNCMVGGALSTGFMHSSDVNELDGLKRFADACRTSGVRACGVSVLTSKTPNLVHQEFNGRTVIEQVFYYAKCMVDAGVTDIICSPQEARFLHQESAFDSLSINTPGIRLAGDSAYDQARVDTPAAALLNGVDMLVIGRSLTQGDPAANFGRIWEEVAAVVNPGPS